MKYNIPLFELEIDERVFNMGIIEEITEKYIKTDIPEFNIGDSVKVHQKIKEGAKERIQIFEGIVISKKHGGIGESFCVRKMSKGEGIEKIFPLHSPMVANIEVVTRGKVRRAKLYYLRDVTGKNAKIKRRIMKKKTEIVEEAETNNG
jgi:large subunit ribosomal protein L19